MIKKETIEMNRGDIMATGVLDSGILGLLCVRSKTGRATNFESSKTIKGVCCREGETWSRFIIPAVVLPGYQTASILACSRLNSFSLNLGLAC